MRGCQRDEGLGELAVGPLVQVTWRRVCALTAERKCPPTARGLQHGPGHLPGEVVSSPSWETRWHNPEELLSASLWERAWAVRGLPVSGVLCLSCFSMSWSLPSYQAPWPLSVCVCVLRARGRGGVSCLPWGVLLNLATTFQRCCGDHLASKRGILSVLRVCLLKSTVFIWVRSTQRRGKEAEGSVHGGRSADPPFFLLSQAPTCQELI